GSSIRKFTTWTLGTDSEHNCKHLPKFLQQRKQMEQRVKVSSIPKDSSGLGLRMRQPGGTAARTEKRFSSAAVVPGKMV
ncbi:unnamed protein product, partial [Amoebophrya sp. A120]